MAPRKRKPPETLPEPETPVAVEPALQDPHEPVTLSREQLADLERTVSEDLLRLDGVFGTYRAKIREFRDLHDGTVEPKWEPFTDSSKVFVPLPRVIKDAAQSRIWQTIFQQKEVAIAESSLQESDVERLHGFPLHEALKAFQRVVNKIALDENELNIREKTDAILNEICITGSCPTRVYHDYLVLPAKLRYDPQGKITREESFVERDAVVVGPLPVESCVWDLLSDSDRLRMFSFDYSLTRGEVKAISRQQKWNTELTTRILNSPDAQPTEQHEDTLRRERLSSATETSPRSTGATFTFAECYYLNQMISEDLYADLVITYHRSTRKILRVILFPYIHNQMPVVIVSYEQVRMRPLARGVIEPIAPIAAGVNAITNQTINSATIRDNPGIIVPENSEAATKLEAGWYPGIVITERSRGEVRTVEFAQAGNTQASLALMDRLFQIAFQVSHLGPPQFGDVSSSRRSPASLGLSIMQQGAELIDKIINRFRITLGRIIMQAVAIYWQTNRGKFMRIVGAEDAALIERLMTQVGLDNLRVTLAVTSASYSKELDRQNYLSMIQTVLTYERQVLELVGQMSGGVDPKSGQPIPPNPTFNAVALEVLRDTQTLMTRWIESFPQVTDASALISDAAGILQDAQQAVSGIGDTLSQFAAGLPPGLAGSIISPPQAFPPPAGLGPGAGALI